MTVQRTNIECSCGERLEMGETAARVRCDCGEIYAVTVTRLSTAEKQ